jgi:hypothetical protein
MPCDCGTSECPIDALDGIHIPHHKFAKNPITKQASGPGMLKRWAYTCPVCKVTNPPTLGNRVIGLWRPGCGTRKDSKDRLHRHLKLEHHM